MHRVGLSALAQPRLIKGDQPYLRPEINPATCNPGAATHHLRMNVFADAMSSHPYQILMQLGQHAVLPLP